MWTVVDGNNDESTWKFSSDNTDGERTYYNYNSTNSGDDWLISPAITPDADGTYIVKYTVKGSSYGEALKVYMASAPTVEALSANMVADHPGLVSEDTEAYFIFDGTAGQPVYIGFYACSAADKWRLYLKGVTVEACDQLLDIAVTDIISPVSGEDLGNETVVAKVKNVGIDAIESFTMSVAVNGETVLTEPVQHLLAAGESADITLNGKIDLSVGHRNYAVTVTAEVPGDISASNNSVTTTVRHIAPATEPYFMGFEPDEDTSDIKFFDLNNDTGNWGIEISSFFMNMARTGVGCIGYNYDKDNSADDWAILDGINIEAGHHVLKFWLSGDSNHPERLSVHYGNSATPEAMTHELARFDPFAYGEYREVILVFEVAEPQTIYIGFHAFSDKDENWITIDDVSLDHISSTESDLSIESVAAPAEFIGPKTTRDVKFTVRSVGIVDAPSKATVYVDGTELTSQELVITAQQVREIVFENALANVAEGMHEIKVEITSDVDGKPENNSITINARILGQPDIVYDFDGETLPADLTFRAEDANTLGSSEFGDLGWGILAIQEHPLYGTGMLGGLTWFTDPTARADRWCVLPKLSVTSEDACFIWNAGAVNTYDGKEEYSIEISEGDDVWYNYTKVLNVPAEGVTRADRGISLANYKDKEIYVAIHLRSVNGELLSMDNLMLYGCSKVNSGIENVGIGSNALNISVNAAGINVAGVDNALIEVFDLAGSLVLRAEGNGADISALAHGTYIARATAGGNTACIKFVR